MLSVGDPLAADLDAEFLTGAAGADLVGLRPEDRIQSGDSYVTVGTVSAADTEILIAAGTAYPAWVTERYLQLPDSLPERVHSLAAEVAGDTDVPYVAAIQIERYLRGNYPFTLRADDPPPRRDVVDFFLFEAREGYFDHHASAMAVLLRTLGIPARVAVGFSIDATAFDEESQSYVLTEEDSWAWPEVYFPGLGWVEFNPTPLRGIITRPGPQFFGLDPDEVALVPAEELLLLDDPGTDDTGIVPFDGLDGVTDPGGSTSYTVPLLSLLALAAGASALYFVGPRRLGVPVPESGPGDRALGQGPAPLRLGRRSGRPSSHPHRGRRRAAARARGRGAGRAARALFHPRALRRRRRFHRRGHGRRPHPPRRALPPRPQPPLPRDGAAPPRPPPPLALAPRPAGFTA